MGTHSVDPVSILAELLVEETFRKSDMPGPVFAGMDPASLPVAGGIHGSGNWAMDTAILGMQSVLNGRSDNNPPPGRIAYRIPASAKYSDYAEAFNGILAEVVAEKWQPTLENLQSVIDSLRLMVTYRPPSEPVVGVEPRNK